MVLTAISVVSSPFPPQRGTATFQRGKRAVLAALSSKGQLWPVTGRVPSSSGHSSETPLLCGSLSGFAWLRGFCSGWSPLAGRQAGTSASKPKSRSLSSPHCSGICVMWGPGSAPSPARGSH